MNEASWKRLMNRIREGNVIPIIGPQLLVEADGHTSLQARIAARLMKDCGKESGVELLPPFRELNVAVSQLKGNGYDSDLYDCVNDAIRAVTGASDFTMPEPIRRLSQIVDFRLFVTLTPDDLLARCLRQRCAVNEIIHSLKLASEENPDLPEDWMKHPGEAYLLYLFGKSHSGPNFAIHDEDFLEYAHNLIVDGNAKFGRFLRQMYSRNLLLIGCNIPDWLNRFILRATRNTRLSVLSPKCEYVIEQLQPQESLTCFLNSYSNGVEILSEIPPIEFVNELYRRWTEERDANAQVTEHMLEKSAPRETMFFISYSRKTDLPFAEALYQSLLGQSVCESEVWFDRNTIEPGQDYLHRILDGIRSCRYFLPIISREVNNREEGVVFAEWNEANERLKGMNYDFLFPVIVDTEYEPEYYTAKPARVWADKHLDYAHAPGGKPDGRFEAKLKSLVRDARRKDKPL